MRAESSKPPEFATWLLEHAVPGGKNEALAGDLLERFGEGRSKAWYWRQVAVAIFAGLSNESRIVWISVAFTAAWTLALDQLYGRFWFKAQAWDIFLFLYAHSNEGLINYAGCLTAFNALPVTFVVVTYLAITRSFGARRFVRGLFAGLLAMGFGFYAVMTLVRSAIHNSFLWHIVALLPIFVSLLVAMWAARPIHDGRSAAKISA
jgi:hypothetical protein